MKGIKMNLKKLKNIKTNYLAKEIIYFNEISSTQNEAEKRIKQNIAKNGEIIIANSQTNGKGTHGRKWYTGNNENIAFSIVLFPNCNINQFKNLTIIIANCIVDTLKKLYNINVNIKYPNDIIYNNLKLGGILTQTTTINEKVKTLIIGIGLNVNQLDFAEEISEIATSLKREFNNIEFSKVDIIKEFCEIFEKEYDNLVE